MKTSHFLQGFMIARTTIEPPKFWANTDNGMGVTPGAIDANDEPIAFMLDHDLVMAVVASV
ncbi:hypothetical protein N7453_002360 [Penicillium expansum]|nr:hypothetical protein N7453_002360 [Penicillium expansum]